MGPFGNFENASYEFERPRARRAPTRVAAIPEPPQPLMPWGGANTALACEGDILKPKSPAQGVFTRKIACATEENAVKEPLSSK